MKNFVRLILMLLFLLTGVFCAYIFMLYLPFVVKNDKNIFLNHLGIQKPEIYGFMPYWLLDRAGKTYPEITNIYYFSLTINDDGSVRKFENPGEEEPGWNKLKTTFTKFKKSNGNIKNYSLVLHLSDENEISELIASATQSAITTASNIHSILRQYGFNQINVDIESFREASASDKLLFNQYLKTIRKKLDSDISISLDLSPSALYKPFIYDIAEISKIVDYIVLMGYDFHYSGSNIAGPVAPIGGAGTWREFDLETALKFAVSIIPSEKLILGIPLYGYEWETISQTTGSPVIPESAATASNRRTEEILSNCPSCQLVFDEVSKSPVIIYRSENETTYHQIYFENEKSLKEKLKLVKTNRLRGIALWALGYEGQTMLKPLTEYKFWANWQPTDFFMDSLQRFLML